MFASGFGQFGAVAALGDVAESFGDTRPGDSIAEQAGLSATALGVGLGIIRLASLLSLPLAGVADRVGRRPTLLWYAVLGLVLTASASLSPTYWWFVLLFALSRPFLTSTNTVGGVAAAELTGAGDRAKALALVAASYGVGAGLVAVTRGLTEGLFGFRGVFALALVPVLLVPSLARRLREPDRYLAAEAAQEKPIPVLGAVGRRFRGRLTVMVSITFAVAAITGPANSFIFLYAENLLGLSPAATAALVVAAGPAGLAGLVLGRWAADRVGRRPTGSLAMVGMGVAGVATYSGSTTAAVAGYLAAVTAGSVFAPAAGALGTELFPTEVRATAAGWSVGFGVLGAVFGLLVFGAMADTYEDFGGAALVLFVPATVVASSFFLVPETKDRELEDWAAG